MAVTLEWVRDNYDANNDCVIGATEFNKAVQDSVNGYITDEQLDTVSGCYRAQTNLCAQSAAPAHGNIVNFNFPQDAKNNERIAIRAAIKNDGGSSGQFKLQLFRGSTRVAYSTTQTIAAGTTGASKTMSVTTPSSGNAIDYQIKCVRTL
jgi:hypothetical protein